MIAELERLFFHAYEPTLGDIVVEVGAGAGGETADLARMVGSDGYVLAVEPHPVSFGLLKDRVRADNVSLINAAVGVTSGTAWISNDGSLLRDHLVGEEYPGALPVVATTLDSLTEDLERIDYLKMNIEGAEADALRGGKKTLAMTSNVVVSCHDFLGMATKTKVTSLLLAAGFAVSGRADAEDSCRADYVYGSR